MLERQRGCKEGAKGSQQERKRGSKREGRKKGQRAGICLCLQVARCVLVAPSWQGRRCALPLHPSGRGADRHRALPRHSTVSPVDPSRGDFVLPAPIDMKGVSPPLLAPTCRTWRLPSPPAPHHGETSAHRAQANLHSLMRMSFVRWGMFLSCSIGTNLTPCQKMTQGAACQNFPNFGRRPGFP